QRQVLLELHAQRGERHRHVHAADLLRHRHVAGGYRDGGLVLLDGSRRLDGPVVLSTAADRTCAERDPGDRREQDRERYRPPPADLALAALPPPLARTSSRVPVVQRTA